MISVIVPVFNVEKYIRECIDSILQQSLKEIQLILVDDGSSDNSGRICDEYAQTDQRIEVIHQANAGCVEAKKRGLQRAAFNYVMFFDSDDWVDGNMCEELLKIATKHEVDFVTSGYIEENRGSCRLATDACPAGLYETEEELNQLKIDYLAYHGTDLCGIVPSTCTKLYRRSLAVKVMEKIPGELYLGEDLLFTSLYLMECSAVYISKAAYYHYRIHDASMVHNPIPDFISQIGIIYEILKEKFMQLPCGMQYLPGLYIRTFLNFRWQWNENQHEIYIPYYYFRMENLGIGRIVLYGAGKVGTDYYEQLHRLMPEKDILWVDRDYQNCHRKYKVYPTEAIQTAEFEKILIAVESEITAAKIKYFLISEYMIPEDRILWQKPECLWI